MTFTLKDKTWLSDINCEALVFQHPSGMRHIHIASNFPELSFCAAFPTATYDDTGMPHILEHMALCGSKDYPQNDPFFSMIHRSVAHDLNAMTDRSVTSYHFVTTDEKDYDNLTALYLDLIFRPLLREKDFLREGWRLEEGEDGKPKLNGIVLNEMMGAYSDGQRQMIEGMVLLMGQGTPAEKMTGGHPLAIAALDHETLKSFYYSRYFYGNSVIVTCGKIDIEHFHGRVMETLSKVDVKKPGPDIENGNGKGIGVNPHHSLEFENARKLDNGKNVVDLRIPGEEGETNYAAWMWRADYEPGSMNELRDQSIARGLFSNTNPAFVKLCRETGLAWEGDLMLHGLARHGGKIGLFILAPGIDPDMVDSLEDRIKQFFDETIEAGLSASAWHYQLESVRSHIRTHRPVHELAVAMSELAVNNYPIDSDTNNMAATETLMAQGVPGSEQLRGWLDRFESVGVMVTKPDPDLMKRWQDQLDEIAKAKYEAGVPFTRENEIVQKDELDVLPRLKTSELNPVIEPMSGIAVVPAVSAKRTNIDKLRQELDALPAMTSLWPQGCGIEPAQEGQVNTATITHVYSTQDEKSMHLLVMFDGTGLDHEDRIRLTALAQVGSKLGNGGMTREQTIEKNMADKVKIRFFTQSKYDIPGLNPWTMTFEARLVNYEEGVKNCGAALHHSYVPTLHEVDLAHAMSQLRQNLLSEIEEIRREEANTKLTSSVVAAQAGELETLVKADELLQYVSWAKDNPGQAAEQIQQSLNKLYHCPRMILSVGDEKMKSQAMNTAIDFASNAPVWQHVLQARDWTPGASGRDHIPMSGGSHDLNRYMGCPNLKQDKHGILTMQVMAKLASPYLHTEIREKGGAYGSGMHVYSHTVRLISGDDPSPDKAYDTFSSLAQWFRNMADNPKEDLLEEARIGVARNLVKPGRGLNGLHSAIANVGRWSAVDSIPNQLADLYKVSWDDIRRQADLVDPLLTPFQDITKGPQAPKPLPSKSKMRLA